MWTSFTRPGMESSQECPLLKVWKYWTVVRQHLDFAKLKIPDLSRLLPRQCQFLDSCLVWQPLAVHVFTSAIITTLKPVSCEKWLSFTFLLSYFHVMRACFKFRFPMLCMFLQTYSTFLEVYTDHLLSFNSQSHSLGMAEVQIRCYPGTLEETQLLEWNSQQRNTNPRRLLKCKIKKTTPLGQRSYMMNQRMLQ